MNKKEQIAVLAKGGVRWERPKKNPQRVRTRYTKEFKLEAVRLLQLGQKPATELALELGIRRNQLYKWA